MINVVLGAILPFRSLDWLKSSHQSHHSLEYHIDRILTNPLRHNTESFSQERQANSFLANFSCLVLNFIPPLIGARSTVAFDLRFRTPLPLHSIHRPLSIIQSNPVRNHSVSALSLSHWFTTQTDFDCSLRVDPNRSRQKPEKISLNVIQELGWEFVVGKTWSILLWLRISTQYWKRLKSTLWYFPNRDAEPNRDAKHQCDCLWPCAEVERDYPLDRSRC